MDEIQAAKIAMALALILAAWSIAIVFLSNPVALWFACLLGVVAILVCPSPP